MLLLVAEVSAVHRARRRLKDGGNDDPNLRAAVDGALITAGGVAVANARRMAPWRIEPHRLMVVWPTAVCWRWADFVPTQSSRGNSVQLLGLVR